MKAFKIYSVCILLLLCSGCAVFTSPQENPVITSDSVLKNLTGLDLDLIGKHTKVFALTPERRTVLVYEEGFTGKLYTCAEPSPDVAESLASTFKAGLKALENDESRMELLRELTTKVEVLFHRSQSIQFLRDGLFSLCQAYMNGVFEMSLEQQRSTKNSTAFSFKPSGQQRSTKNNTDFSLKPSGQQRRGAKNNTDFSFKPSGQQRRGTKNNTGLFLKTYSDIIKTSGALLLREMELSEKISKKKTASAKAIEAIIDEATKAKATIGKNKAEAIVEAIKSQTEIAQAIVAKEKEIVRAIEAIIGQAMKTKNEIVRMIEAEIAETVKEKIDQAVKEKINTAVDEAINAKKDIDNIANEASGKIMPKATIAQATTEAIEAEKVKAIKEIMNEATKFSP